MTSYLVALATDHHQTCLKICGMNEQFGMNERLLKTSSFYVSSSKKKLKKTLWGGGGVASTYVRGLKLYFDMIFILDLGRNFWDNFPRIFFTFRVWIKPAKQVVVEPL